MATEKTNIWAFLQKLIQNKWFWISVAVLLLGTYIYMQGKKAAATDQAILPNGGTGIPLGWDPTNDATKLHDAMATGSVFWGAIDYGTDEQTIFDTLDPLTEDQCAAVNNRFNELYQAESEMTLREWFEDELSGDDLDRALGYFNGITGF